jgi:LPXTG-site transpeptidase (sortase) family protein
MTNRTARVLGGSRRRTVVAAGVVIVAGVIGLAMAFGGPAGTTAPTATPRIEPSASPAFGDLPLVTVTPTASPLDAGSETAAPSSTPAAEKGIRANRIRIARLGIDLAIVEGDGLDAPIGKAAHYPGSAWPGGGSNIYIYGHARQGMFITLWRVRVGDTIALDLVDGASRTYVVAEILPKVAFDAVEYLKPTKTEQLTLQTSTSYYPTAPRFVVIAVPQT